MKSFAALTAAAGALAVGSPALAAGDSNEASDAFLQSLNPVIFYDFDTPVGQTTDLNDGTGTSSAITLTGGTSTAGNRIGLDGVNDFGSFTGLGADLDGASAVTIMMTTNFVQGGATGSRYFWSEPSTAGQPLTVRGDRDFTSIEGRSEGGDGFQSHGFRAEEANDFDLHHRAWVFDYANDTSKHYVDGELVATKTNLNFGSTTLDGSIFGGEGFLGAANGSSDFQDATVDQFAIFDREVSASNINTIATIVPEPGSMALVAAGGALLLGRRRKA